MTAKEFDKILWQRGDVIETTDGREYEVLEIDFHNRLIGGTPDGDIYELIALPEIKRIVNEQTK